MSEPIILCMGCAVVGLEPDTGAIRWMVPTQLPVTRMFRVASSLFAIASKVVVCIDVASGSVVGQLDLGFPAETGLVCGDTLVLARGVSSSRLDGVVCLTLDGRIKWKGAVTIESTGILRGNALLRMSGPNGEALGEVRYPFSSGSAGIAHGSNVAQPDLFERPV